MAIIVKRNGGLELGAAEAQSLRNILAQLDDDAYAALGLSTADAELGLDVYGALEDSRAESACQA